jgi:xanthine dehydrogenase accessory factor
VYELCRTAIETGAPKLQRYGISDDDAFEVGLTCGGIIDLFVERVDQQTFPELGEVAASIERGEPVAIVTCIEGPPDRLGHRLVVWPDRRSGSLGLERLDDAVADDGRGLLAGGRTGILHYGHDGERRGDDIAVFISSYAPRPRMLVFGAIDFAAAVARVGVFLGYKVTVCDAREVFATAKRFRDADEVVVDWPHRYLTGELDQGNLDERTVVCVLTHDPKFDVPVLEVALRQSFAYVGAMGSRRTHDDRMKRLREAGMTEEELTRLSSPIGLDLGARTPEETAVSIAAEIIAARWGGGGSRLSATEGRIHHEAMHGGDSEPARIGS